MSYHPDLVAEIEAFCSDNEMSEITFGRLALRDPHFVRDIRDKRRLFRPTEDKVRFFMASYSPDPDQPSTGQSDKLSGQEAA